MSILFPAERRATAQQKVARRKAIERRLTAYVELTCGDLTTRETTEQFSAWAPKGLPHFCEACHEYRREQPKPATRTQFPDEPPF